MSEGVRSDGFVYFCEFSGAMNCFLQNAFVKMVAADHTRCPIHGALRGRKDELPVPVLSSISIFDAQGIGQDGFSVAFAQVFVVQSFDIL